MCVCVCVCVHVCVWALTYIVWIELHLYHNRSMPLLLHKSIVKLRISVNNKDILDYCINGEAEYRIVEYVSKFLEYKFPYK